MKDIDDLVDQCKVHVVSDVERFQERIREQIGWTDTKLLRALLALIETQSWQARSDSQ